MKRSEKQIFLETMISEVKEIPVEDIIGSVLELTPKSSNLLALCPFHPDNHLGSFVITPSKNLWWCFACGKGGNGIKFAMEYYEIPFLQVCFKLALDFGIITQEEATNYSRKKYDVTLIKHIEREVLEIKKEAAPEIADADILHYVFEAMATVCGLSDQHRKHLLEDRKLQENELADFFTFPTRRLNLKEKVLEEIKNRLIRFYCSDGNPSENQLAQIERQLKRVERELKKVPGFYENADENIDFVSFKGIGFLIRDLKGHVKGIQIRRDKVKSNESRYVWFSSAFAAKLDGCQGGASSGSPGGYIAPKKQISHPIPAITEGRFKAEAIAQIGCPTVYVSGVSTWRSILPMVGELQEKMGEKRIYLIFDSDILGNMAVYEQLCSMAFQLQKESAIPYVVLWNSEMGKGFDDMFLSVGINNVCNVCKSIPIKDFKKTYQLSLKKTLESFNVSNVKALGKEKIDDFCAHLFAKNVQSFNLGGKNDKKEDGDKK